MSKVKILVVGRNAEIVEIMLRLINKNEAWFALSAMDDSEAVSVFTQHDIDLVMLSSGIPAVSEALLRKTFTAQKTAVKIIQHFGGGSGLLSNEILAALDVKPLFFDTDNAL